MSKEQNRSVQRIPQSSIRDYWQNPTGSPPPFAKAQNRRDLSEPLAPSLWDTLSLPSLGIQATTPTSSAVPSYANSALISHEESEETGSSHPLHLREQLQRRGVSTLSTPELLTIILHAGQESENTVPRIQTLLSSLSVQQLRQADFGELCGQYGLGEAKAAQLQALLEVARRLTLPSNEGRQQIKTPSDAARIVSPEMEFLDHEELRVLLLNTKYYVTANLLLYRGTLDSSVLRAAEVFRPAVTRQAASIIVCHNHPSGDPTPSQADITVTKQLVEAGKLLDVELADHLIIGSNNRFVSLKERLLW